MGLQERSGATSGLRGYFSFFHFFILHHIESERSSRDEDQASTFGDSVARGRSAQLPRVPIASKSEMKRQKSQDAKIGRAPRRNQDTPRSRTLRRERVHIVQVPREGYQRTTPTSSRERAVTGRERAKQGHIDPRIPAGIFCRRHLPESEQERAFLLRCKQQESPRVLP